MAYISEKDLETLQAERDQLREQNRELVKALELAQATIERLTVRHGPFASTDGTQSVIRAALAKSST